MDRLGSRVPPIVAGLAGLVWVWSELAPQRLGFPDTDDPAVSLRFLEANPAAWTLAGYSLAIAALALIPTVLAMGSRLRPEGPAQTSDLAAGTITVVGLMGAAMLLGMAAVRLAVEPVRYVHSLSQAWGETAYLVTQFVGPQLLGIAGLALLAMWIGGVAWVGGRRGVVPRGLALLGLFPAVRLAALPGIKVLPESAWVLLMAAIPAAFLWLLLLGAWPSVNAAAGPVPAPAPGALAP